MAEIKVRLKHWWQARGHRSSGPVSRVSQDVLHLYRLRREHRLLRVKLPGVEGDLQSLLLEIDLQNQRLLLDEPFPQRMAMEALIGRRLQVASIEGASSTRFETQVLAVENLRGLPVLSVALPVSVLAAQRRNNYRLAVDEHTHVQAILRHAVLGNLAARVQDLSVQGIRFEVPGIVSDALGTVANLFLRPGSEPGMLCNLRVCSLVPNTTEETTLVGGQFQGLNPPQVQVIQRFIVRTQRAQRQREMALTS